MSKNILWLSSQEAYYRREIITKYKWLNYGDILEFSQGKSKIKSWQNLILEGYNMSMVFLCTIIERLEIDRKTFVFEHFKTELQKDKVKMLKTLWLKYIHFTEIWNRSTSERIG